jgi:Flp pilus assembly pilin Flp
LSNGAHPAARVAVTVVLLPVPVVRSCETGQELLKFPWTMGESRPKFSVVGNPASVMRAGVHISGQARSRYGKESIMKWVIALLRQEEAHAAVEYAVMLALILAGIIASIASVGSGTGGLWSSTYSAFQTVGFGS